MIVYNNLKIKHKYKNSAIAIGNFDGLHLGHKKVLNQCRIIAKKNKIKFGLLTFEPVPVLFFNPKIKNHKINNIEKKKFFLNKLNLDFLMIIKFNKLFSNLSSESFIKKLLYKKINCKYIFVSKNFKFGKGRLGNIKTLKKFEKKYLYKTVVINPFKRNKKLISSSIIRKKIAEGKVVDAQKLLGRPWSIQGIVIKGNQRGRKIGFPTCNISLADYIIPKLGVYSVEVETKFFKRKGIANIGYRPTFRGKKLLLEVNIFGINSNLYKKTIKVNFIKFIRKEKKFKGVSQLKEQIKKDIAIAKK